MKRRLALLAAAAMVALSSCSKKQESAPAVLDSPDTLSTPAPTPPAPSHVTANAQNAPTQSAEGEVHPFLTQQLQIFVKQKGRMPQSFAELAAARLDSVPRPPEGRKWVIDATTMQVKAGKAQ